MIEVVLRCYNTEFNMQLFQDDHALTHRDYSHIFTAQLPNKSSPYVSGRTRNKYHTGDSYTLAYTAASEE